MTGISFIGSTSWTEETASTCYQAGSPDSAADEDWLRQVESKCKGALQQFQLQSKLLSKSLTPNAALQRFQGSANLTVEQARIVLIDPKLGVDYFAFDGLPHLEGGIIGDQENMSSQASTPAAAYSASIRAFRSRPEPQPTSRIRLPGVKAVAK